MKPVNSRKRKTANKKGLYLLVGVVLIGAVAGALYLKMRSHQKAQLSNSSQASPSPKRLRLIATGDFIAHDAINLRAEQPDGTYQYGPFLEGMKQSFDKADVRFCNQAVPGGGKQFGISGYPVFNSPLEVVHDMARLGCNVINTGTNHTFDKGQGVITAELNEWDKQPDILAVAGANRSSEEQQKIRYFTVKGITFAFLSYTTYTNSPSPNSYGLNVFNEVTAQREVATARSQADVVLVSMRWGTEYSPGINQAQERYAQELADWGADIVLGHGPHVLEPVKRLKGKDGRYTLVWYSIGNFFSAQEEIEALTGCVAVMDFDLQTKKVNSLGCLPIYMHYEWTADEKAREALLARRNFTLVPLDLAAPLLAKSQNNTTVDAQTNRIKAVLNTFMPVPIISSKDY